MSDEAYTGFTVSFRPGGKDYDSPLLVVRALTEDELMEKLGVDATDPDGTCELGTAIASFHDKLRTQFDDVVAVSAPREAAKAVGFSSPAPAAAPIWESGPASGGLLVANPDGTYPPCPHGSRPRKPWTSPRNGKRYLFCALDKGAPGACPTVTL